MQYKSERVEILKSDFHHWNEMKPDKEEGIPNPPLLKAPSGGPITNLCKTFDHIVIDKSFKQILNERHSQRKFSNSPLSLDELSFLLFYTQGIKKVTPQYTFRTVPSGGIRHPFETYLAVNNVDNLTPGIYHYLPEQHALELLFEDSDQIEHISKAALKQTYVANCAVTFMWSVIPYRTVWRYHMSAYKTILLDAGHISENLYLLTTSIACGTVAIGKYDQEYLDRYLRLDGENEFIVLIAPVGKQ